MSITALLRARNARFRTLIVNDAAMLIVNVAQQGGAAVGAVVGILFPPSIIGTALVGAAVGGVGGHLWRGMSRADVKEFGEIIDTGQAALIIVGESKLEQALDKAQLKAEKHVAKELNVSAKDVDKAVQEAAGEVG